MSLSVLPEGESEQYRRWYEIYRDLPSDKRSYRVVADIVLRSENHVKNVGAQYGWAKKAKGYDAYSEQEELKKVNVDAVRLEKPKYSRRTIANSDKVYQDHLVS